MKKQEYENICQAINAGQEHEVEHQITHQTAKVVACHGINFEVDLDGEQHQNWARQNCETSS